MPHWCLHRRFFALKVRRRKFSFVTKLTCRRRALGALPKEPTLGCRPQIQPCPWATCAASILLAAPVLPMALDR